MEKNTPGNNPAAANEARQSRAEKNRSSEKSERAKPKERENPAYHPTPGSAEGERDLTEQGK